MAAPKGNRYGVDSENFFKPKKYSPEEWCSVFIQYLSVRGEEKWNKKEAIKSGDMAGKTMSVPVEMPLSIESFCVFAGVHKQTFYNYEGKGVDNNYEEYIDSTTRMREVIEANQLDGATVNAFNPGIIAKRLSMVDKKDITSKGEKIEKGTSIENVVVEFVDYSENED